MHTWDSVLYVVGGATLYKIDASYAVTILGTVPGSSQVGMAHNLTQLIVVDGDTGYIYDGTFQTIDSDGFFGGDVVKYLDTYFLVNQPGTWTFWVSNSNNGLVWNALDFASKEASADNLVAIWTNNEDLMLFGETTLEFWRDTGNADFQFEKQVGLSQERGCAAKRSVASLDNTVAWLGDDKVVYKLEGYRPVRISDHGLEAFLNDIDVSAASAFAYTQNGHYFYVLNVGDRTWVYDSTYSVQVGSATWHERETGLDGGRWRGATYAKCFGKHLIGDYAIGTIWELRLDTFTDDGEPIKRSRTMPTVFGDVRPVSVDRLELKILSGLGNNAVTDPQIWLEVSKNGGQSWGSRILRTMGEVGQYEARCIWRRLGRAVDWTFRFTTTEATDLCWMEAYGELTAGEM